MQSDSEVNLLQLDPVTTLRTSAGKVTFSELVLPAALPCRQRVLDDAATVHDSKLISKFSSFHMTKLTCLQLRCASLLEYVGMCGMDFSSSVRFRFGFEKNRGFGSVFFVDQLENTKKRVSCLSCAFCILVDSFLNAQLLVFYWFLFAHLQLDSRID